MMESMITLLGYSSILIMGVLLGLLGGGGSILTIPILVYFFGISPLLATGYSLFVVGVSSSVAVYQYYKEKWVHIKVGVLFGIPATVGVLLSRMVILPYLPNQIQLAGVTFSKDKLILWIFATLVLVISLFMIKSKDVEEVNKAAKNPVKIQYPPILLGGFILGVITGFVGAGGGFMIVPALLVLTPITLKQSIATSLFIISIKSSMGFLGDLIEGGQFDGLFLSQLLIITMLGILIGTKLNKRVPSHYLRKGFGVFVFVMGLLIMLNQ